MARKYFSCSETAKLVRKALAEAFPGIKFSVRSHVYAGGASINVRYVDGPSAKLVESVAKVFCGAGFDSSVDLKYYEQNMIGGEVVSFGADFIFVDREYSDAAVERAIAATFKRYAGNLDGIAVPSVEDFRMGRMAYKQALGNWTASDLIRIRLAAVTDRFVAANSPTANSVIYCGNDHEGAASFGSAVEA